MTYRIVRSSRRTVGISIYPSKEIVIKVPTRFPVYKIEAIIRQKQGWIDSKMQELEAKGFFTQKEKKYENDEEFCLLGKKYILRVVANTKNFVEVLSDDICVYKKEKIAVKTLLSKFFLQKSHEVFAEQMAICFEHFARFFVCNKPVVRVRKMKSRWGSCSSKGVVTLNSLLIHVPIECINYVIIHELCHLKHANHSGDFYSLQQQINPKWKENKSVLEGFMGEVASL